uniref:long-chain fatty acid--CoA ligase n=1 Tax=Pseudomonas viridiflava TaxID=33069 RepID=UPI0013DEB517
CQDRPFGTIRTGDLFKVVNGGLLFAGRSGRLIVRGGENIYPSVIESAILKYLDIDDVWVTSEPDEKLGRVAKAYVVGDKKLDINYMSRRLRRFLPSSYIPAIWKYAEKLPAQAKK